MPVRQLHFFMPLGNADESILKIKLNEGFEFGSMTYAEGRQFLSNLEKVPVEMLFNYWWYSSTVFPHGGLYYIKKTFEFDLPLNENGDPEYSAELYQFVYNLVEKNIETSLRLLRLFKEGNIYLPCWYVYSINNGVPTVIYAQGNPNFQKQSLYHLNEVEIKEAQNFIESTKIPFAFDYIKLAHDNYELSYTIRDDSLAFLTLMISLELLFKPPRKSGFSGEISKNIGTLLGNSQDQSNKIQQEVTDLYAKRNGLIHEGKIIWCFVGEVDPLTILRGYVRDSIKKIYQLNLLKDNFLEYLKTLDTQQDG